MMLFVLDDPLNIVFSFEHIINYTVKWRRIGFGNVMWASVQLSVALIVGLLSFGYLIELFKVS